MGNTDCGPLIPVEQKLPNEGEGAGIRAGFFCALWKANSCTFSEIIKIRNHK